MFRVSSVEESTRTVITVDGRLSGESIASLETCCGRAMAAGKPVDLVLRDVPAIDPEGRELLRRLAAGGVRLEGRGVYTSYVAQSLQHG